MSLSPLSNVGFSSPLPVAPAAAVRPPVAQAPDGKLRKEFDTFMGEAFYGQLLSAMRKSTTGHAAYFHGGQAEETFRGQLDQVLATKMTEASASEFTGPMFELFQLQQK